MQGQGTDTLCLETGRKAYVLSGVGRRKGGQGKGETCLLAVGTATLLPSAFFKKTGRERNADEESQGMRLGRMSSLTAQCVLDGHQCRAPVKFLEWHKIYGRGMSGRDCVSVSERRGGIGWPLDLI